MPLIVSLRGVLFVVVDDESIDRIRRHDPCEITRAWTRQLAIDFPLELVIAYAEPHEYDRLDTMTPEALVEYLFRGYQFTDADRARGRLLARRDHHGDGHARAPAIEDDEQYALSVYRALDDAALQQLRAAFALDRVADIRAFCDRRVAIIDRVLRERRS